MLPLISTSIAETSFSSLKDPVTPWKMHHQQRGWTPSLRVMHFEPLKHLSPWRTIALIAHMDVFRQIRMILLSSSASWPSHVGKSCQSTSAQVAALKNSHPSYGTASRCIHHGCRLDSVDPSVSDYRRVSCPPACAAISGSTFHLRIWALAIHLNALRGTDPKHIVAPD
jgi:hypothetical protein